MSDKLRNIGDEHLNEDEIDAILGNAIQAKFDAELKMDLKKSLRQDYGIARKNKTINLKDRNNKNRFFFMAAIAAGFLLLILAWNVFLPSQDNVQELANAYLINAEIYHSGALKGNAQNEEARLQAIRSFNTGNYAQAEQYFSSIEEKTEEDIFYSGISSLYNEKYKDAITKLESLSDLKSRYQEEANWFLAIAYILDGDLTVAEDLLSKMESSSWNYDKTEKLLKALE